MGVVVVVVPWEIDVREFGQKCPTTADSSTSGRIFARGTVHPSAFHHYHRPFRTFSNSLGECLLLSALAASAVAAVLLSLEALAMASEWARVYEQQLKSTELTGERTQMARNTYVAPGVEKLSRSKLYSKKGSYKRTYPDQAGASSENVAPGKSETKKLKNGSERVVPKGSARSQRYYAVDEVKAPKSGRKTKVSRPTKLRSSITPGTVLILLAGRFRGRRVVCLKQLSSGLLLVTGPFKINGVPLKRVNQAYVIATSTKVDISAVEVRSSSWHL